MSIDRESDIARQMVDSLGFSANRLLEFWDEPVAEQLIQAQLDYKVGHLILPWHGTDQNRPWSKQAIKYELEKGGFTILEWPELGDSINFVVDELAKSGLLRNRVGEVPKVPVGKRAIFSFRRGEEFLAKTEEFRISLATNLEILDFTSRENSFLP